MVAATDAKKLTLETFENVRRMQIMRAAACTVGREGRRARIREGFGRSAGALRTGAPSGHAITHSARGGPRQLLRYYLREQAVTETPHRYGNIMAKPKRGGVRGNPGNLQIPRISPFGDQLQVVGIIKAFE